MEVKLLNWTRDTIETMCYVRRAMHAKVPETISELKENPEKWLGKSIDEYFEDILLNDNMPNFLEFISTVWKFEGVSRALQQQLTRHRIGFSYSIQSMRVVPAEYFADNENYTFPEFGDKVAFASAMKEIQNLYRDLLESGMPVQDARGILPMNIHSTITFSANLRALFNMINKRLCLKTQKEFRDVASLMVKEIKKIDKRLLRWIGPPCKIEGKCIMHAENLEQWKHGKIAGKANTESVCPLWIELFSGCDE